MVHGKKFLSTKSTSPSTFPKLGAHGSKHEGDDKDPCVYILDADVGQPEFGMLKVMELYKVPANCPLQFPPLHDVVRGGHVVPQPCHKEDDYSRSPCGIHSTPVSLEEPTKSHMN